MRDEATWGFESDEQVHCLTTAIHLADSYSMLSKLWERGVSGCSLMLFGYRLYLNETFSDETMHLTTYTKSASLSQSLSFWYPNTYE